MGVQAAGSRAEGHQQATRTRPREGAARDARLMDRLGCPRRQMKQREGRPADPGPSERSSSIQSDEAKAGSAEHAEGTLRPARAKCALLRPHHQARTRERNGMTESKT